VENLLYGKEVYIMAVKDYDGSQELKGLITFSAPWCSGCKMVAPMLESLDQEVLKVNVDDHEEVAAKFGIMGIPVLLEVEGEDVKMKKVGHAEIMAHLG
jgi:thioredoxin 1